MSPGLDATLFSPHPPCYMGLSSCYWLYDIQHGVSHDVLTSQLEEYPSWKRLRESQKIKINNNKKKSDTPTNNRGIDSTFARSVSNCAAAAGFCVLSCCLETETHPTERGATCQQDKDVILRRVMVGCERGNRVVLDASIYNLWSTVVGSMSHCVSRWHLVMLGRSRCGGVVSIRKNPG